MIVSQLERKGCIRKDERPIQTAPLPGTAPRCDPSHPSVKKKVKRMSGGCGTDLGESSRSTSPPGGPAISASVERGQLAHWPTAMEGHGRCKRPGRVYRRDTGVAVVVRDEMVEETLPSLSHQVRRICGSGPGNGRGRERQQDKRSTVDGTGAS